MRKQIEAKVQVFDALTEKVLGPFSESYAMRVLVEANPARFSIVVDEKEELKEGLADLGKAIEEKKEEKGGIIPKAEEKPVAQKPASKRRGRRKTTK